MSKTILITGASTGIGRATASLFRERGWNVVATMRSPDSAGDLAGFDDVLVTRLDVTDPASIGSAVNAAMDRFGRIDVLVNNAGYAAYGPLEATPPEKIRRQFDTNVIGLLDVTRAVLPHMRAQGDGVIVNISSIGGRMTFPLGSLYHGSKFAVEGISEALSFEMQPIGVRVKIIEPGMIATDFAGRSFDFTNDEGMVEYQGVVRALLGAFANVTAQASPPTVVAEVIHQAVTDGTDQLRYPAGEDAKVLMANRSALDDATFIGGVKQQMGL